MFLIERGIGLVLSASMLSASCGPSENQSLPEPLFESGPVENTVLPRPIFEQGECDLLGAQVLVPIGWYVKQNPSTPIPDNLTETSCFITKDPVRAGQNFTTGMSISRIELLPLGVADIYAKIKATSSKPSRELVDGSYNPKQVGRLLVHESRFISTENNLLSDQWVLSVNIDGDLYVVQFSAPRTSSEADFNQYGSQMLADLRINGHPIKESTTS